MFRLLPSHLQALKEYRSNVQGSQVHCGIPKAYIVVIVTIRNHIQGVPGGKDLTSGECSLGQTIPI